MRVALYARVSTESQQARGTIGSQLAVLRERVARRGRRGGRRVLRRRPLRGPAGPARAGRAARRRRGRADRAGVVPVPGPARPRLRLPGDRARRAGPPRGQRAVHRRPTARRRPAGHAAHPGPGRDRRVRAGEDRRAVPAREAVPLPRRGGAGLAHPLRLPAPPPRRARPGPAGGVRTRGRHRPPDLRRLRRTAGTPCGRSSGGWPPTACRPRPGRAGSGAPRRCAAAAQRGLHRAGLLQPHRGRPRPAPRAAQQAGPPPPRGLDHHRGARHRR